MNYIHWSSRRFILAPDNFNPADTVFFVYRNLEEFKIQFVDDDGTIMDLDATGTLRIKGKGKFDTAAPFVYASSWTKVNSGADTYYVFDIDTFTAGIQAALEDNGSDTDDQGSVEVEFQVQWVADGKTRSTLPFATPPRIYNSLDRDEEDPPPAGPPDPEAWLAARAVLITSQTLTDAQKWVVLGNLGWSYDATLGGITITLADGSSAFIRLTTVPT
jgi:hypothetical protein